MKAFRYLLLLIACLDCRSQNSGSLWYFGEHAGLDFSSGVPVSVIGGATNTNEGCAVLSDGNGGLLFYTDGVNVWDRNHQIMPNGTGLTGNSSSSQSALIVPNPQNANLYYVFTTTNVGMPNGMRYSVVDMSLNGSNGVVTSTKNIALASPVCEKVSAVKKTSGDGFWIVTHGFGSNTFFVYDVGPSGLNPTPTQQNVGTVIPADNQNNALGYLKFSTNGSRMVLANGALNAELFDFDTNTGQISNPKVITTKYTYGAEFSPSGNLLYLTASPTSINSNELLQFDLSSADIPSSQVVLYNADPLTNEVLGALQLGPDGKVYMAIGYRDFVSAIHNPDVVGPSSNFEQGAVPLVSGVCINGLPQPPPTFFDASFSVQNLCLGNQTHFSLNTVQNVQSVLWDFGDSTSFSGLEASHGYAQPGNYLVTATITGTSATVVRTRTVTISIAPPQTIAIPDQFVCVPGSLTVSLSQFDNLISNSLPAGPFGFRYFATFENADQDTSPLTSTYTLPQNGDPVYVRVYNSANPACHAVAVFHVTVANMPTFAAAPTDVSICDDLSNDGFGLFDLQSKANAILGNLNPNDYEVNFYVSQSNADSDTGRLPLSYQNVSNPQTLYARLSNATSPHCFSTSSFVVSVEKIPVANMLQDLGLCDDSNDGHEMFDLESQTPQLLGYQSPSDFGVSYHLSQQDADSGDNPLPSTYTNETNPQLIFARVFNTSGTCFATTSFQIRVEPSPMLHLQSSYAICDSGTPLVLTAPAGFSSYAWSSGATSQTVVLSAPGNYSLTVTNIYGSTSCVQTQDFVVVASETPVIQGIVLSDWTASENSITITTQNGNVAYEYSLDGVNFQSANVFVGLANGAYHVYVRDQNRCGLADKEVYLLMYPNYFTPNGDGIHDKWKIPFSDEEIGFSYTIFDRFGKLLYSGLGSDQGWDGTYSGKVAPSSDYWFVVERGSGAIFKGHFSLKR